MKKKDLHITIWWLLLPLLIYYLVNNGIVMAGAWLLQKFMQAQQADSSHILQYLQTVVKMTGMFLPQSINNASAVPSRAESRRRVYFTFPSPIRSFTLQTECSLSQLAEQSHSLGSRVAGAGWACAALLVMPLQHVQTHKFSTSSRPSFFTCTGEKLIPTSH